MIIIPIFIMLLILFVRIQKGMFPAFLVIVSTKSLMDIFWNIEVGPISVLAIQGAIFPIIFYKLFSKLKQLPSYWKGSANIYITALSFGLFWSIVSDPIIGFQNLVLNINIFLGFLIIPLLITTKKRLNQFLFALIFSGLFPVIVSLYQFNTGVIFQDRATIGLTRYVGFYHDAFPVRFYGLMTLIAIFIYTLANKIGKVAIKFFLITVMLGSLFSIYLVFSKAAVSILALWIATSLFLSKSKLRQILSVFFSLLVLFLVFGDAFSLNIEQLFSKEVGYQSGSIKDARYTLAGRGYIWQDFWNFWVSKQTVFYQWFGDGISRPTHNEFLRVLMTSGIIGLIVFVFFLLRTMVQIVKIKKNIKVLGVMLFGMYFIDSIGLVPGVYYYYNILVWGIFGLLLIRPYLLIK